jgi:hypothetical protein
MVSEHLRDLPRHLQMARVTVALPVAANAEVEWLLPPERANVVDGAYAAQTIGTPASSASSSKRCETSP